MLNRQTGDKGDSGGRQPRRPINELCNGELAGFHGGGDDPITGPSDPLTHRPARPIIHILPIVQGIKGEITIPFEPPSRAYVVSHVGKHVDCPRVELPWTAQIRRVAGLDGLEV